MGSYPRHTPGTQPYARRLPDEELEAAAPAIRAEMVRKIAEGGAFEGGEEWRRIFEAVPRHVFVPWYYVAAGEGFERLWGEDADPGRRARWLRGAYADGALATRVRGDELLSSASQPSLMARMLAELRVRDGDRVLEIGTGTGYNAALLSARVGAERVTTVDLDAELTESARGHLHAAGWAPAVVTGDGFRGCPERAPYDRIIATCTLSCVPPSWLDQCAAGARIVSPVATGLAALDVLGPGRAEGRFLATPAYFVPLRGPGHPDDVAPPAGLPARAPADERFGFFALLSAGALDPEEAMAVWEAEGAPSRDRFGITVDGEQQWAWLDDPEGPYTWRL